MDTNGAVEGSIVVRLNTVANLWHVESNRPTVGPQRKAFVCQIDVDCQMDAESRRGLHLLNRSADLEPRDTCSLPDDSSVSPLS